MAKTGLLPCPFCGGEANIIEYPAHSHSPALVAVIGIPDHPGSWASECQRCGCGLIHATEAEAVAAWNRRAANSDGGVDWPRAIDRCIDRMRALPEYAGRPSWEEILCEELTDLAHPPAKALDGIAVSEDMLERAGRAFAAIAFEAAFEADAESEWHRIATPMRAALTAALAVR